jgi:FAD/FMN-containing dehydrogenase
VNFFGKVAPAAVHQAYPGKTWQRLAEVKARYDPDNFFHNNQNIPPA